MRREQENKQEISTIYELKNVLMRSLNEAVYLMLCLSCELIQSQVIKLQLCSFLGRARGLLGSVELTYLVRFYNQILIAYSLIHA